MSGYRDSSQGHGFAFPNQKEIVFNKPEDKPAPTPQETLPEIDLDLKESEEMKYLKESLERLQQLHHDLHSLLAELDQPSPAKKKSTKK